MRNNNHDIKNEKNKRKNKRKLKKEIVVPMMGVVILASGFTLYSVKNTVEEYKVELEKKEAERIRIEAERIRIENLKKQFPSVSEAGLDDAYDANDVWNRLNTYNTSAINEEKIVFLTYDDGPSTTNTPTILETLKKHNVKATFFVNGKTLESGGEEAKKILKESYEYGNSIANHSYSHDYGTLYPNRSVDLESFLNDFKKNDALLKEVLGEDFKTNVWRCPGGLMSWKNTDTLKDYAQKNDISIIDWNALNKDAEGKKKNAEELYQEAISTSEGKDMVVLLMHDTYGKEATAEYTDKIIQYYKSQGYIFKTLA